VAAEARRRRGPQAEGLRRVRAAGDALALRRAIVAPTRQSFLGRIVDIGAELFAISAAVVYADTIARETPERAESARELADLFCAQARRRADGLFHALWNNDDDAGYATAMKLLEGRYTWLEEGVSDPGDR
jgi:hypothetical protein